MLVRLSQLKITCDVETKSLLKLLGSGRGRRVGVEVVGRGSPLSLGKQGAKTSLNLLPLLSITFVILFQIQSVRSRLKHYVASSLIGNCGKYLPTIVTSLYSRVDFIFENSIKSYRSKPGKSG